MSSTTPHQIYTDDDYYLLKSQYDRLLDLVNPHATGDWEYDLETTGKSMVKLIEDNDTYILKQQNERLNDRIVELEDDNDTDFLKEEIVRLNEEVKELKVEIEELQEMEDCDLFERLYDSLHYEEWIEGSDLYQELQEEYEKLENIVEHYRGVMNEIDELEKEDPHGCVFDDTSAELVCYIKRLKDTSDKRNEKIHRLEADFQGCRECLIQNVNARKMDQSCIEDQREIIAVLKAEIDSPK